MVYVSIYQFPPHPMSHTHIGWRLPTDWPTWSSTQRTYERRYIVTAGTAFLSDGTELTNCHPPKQILGQPRDKNTCCLLTQTSIILNIYHFSTYAHCGLVVVALVGQGARVHYQKIDVVTYSLCLRTYLKGRLASWLNDNTWAGAGFFGGRFPHVKRHVPRDERLTLF